MKYNIVYKIICSNKKQYSRICVYIKNFFPRVVSDKICSMLCPENISFENECSIESNIYG